MLCFFLMVFLGTEAGSTLRVALVALLEQVLAHRKAADSIGCLMRDNTHALMYVMRHVLSLV